MPRESRESCSTEFCTHTDIFTTALPRLAKKETAVWLEKMNGKNVFGIKTAERVSGHSCTL